MTDLLYQIALTQVPNIGYVHARTLAQHFESAEAIFKARRSSLEKIDGIGTVRAESIKAYQSFTSAEQEMAFIHKHGIQALFITDPAYPQRLLHCYDAPALLFYKGSADLNASRMVAIVGTRSNTDYGRQVTETLVNELSAVKPVIVSGLAFGIDAAAHRSALKNDLPTIGVVGHGLDQVYPPAHGALAKEMIRQGGGLLTEFRSGTKPDKHNFPGRNRVVAALSDATIVVETSIKGGSLITAELANSYNRDVFAVPGRTNDVRSEGCNDLIKNNKAILLTDAAQFIQLMGWQEQQKPAKPAQKQLFIQLSADEEKIMGLLKEKELVHIDELNLRSGLSNSAVAAAILNLELQGVVRSMPGKMYGVV
jgi:DNA processing protein